MASIAASPSPESSPSSSSSSVSFISTYGVGLAAVALVIGLAVAVAVTLHRRNFRKPSTISTQHSEPPMTVVTVTHQIPPNRQSTSSSSTRLTKAQWARPNTNAMAAGSKTRSTSRAQDGAIPAWKRMSGGEQNRRSVMYLEDLRATHGRGVLPPGASSKIRLSKDLSSYQFNQQPAVVGHSNLSQTSLYDSSINDDPTAGSITIPIDDYTLEDYTAGYTSELPMPAKTFQN
ncbi:hypothetical protein HDU97_000304 [Phlyctochytrium planicorne]|nr:hypothetical protein HDU97_000304 [Phlyctochytrium planicorne]